MARSEEQSEKKKGNTGKDVPGLLLSGLCCSPPSEFRETITPIPWRQQNWFSTEKRHAILAGKRNGEVACGYREKEFKILVSMT